jgi:hypothetical protein
VTTTPPEQPDPWAPQPGRTPAWDQPAAPPPPPGYGGPTPPPGYGQPGWPQQPPPGTGWDAPGYGNWAPTRNNGLGTAALVLGILSLPALVTVVGGVVLGILAIIFGFLGRGRVKRREADNGGMALAGIILGFVSLAISVLVVLFVVVLANKYDDCIDRGNTVEYCDANFADEFGS